MERGVKQECWLQLNKRVGKLLKRFLDDVAIARLSAVIDRRYS